MSTFYDAFIKFRNLFTSEKSIIEQDTEKILEGLNKMAADLSKLIEEVNRVDVVQQNAIRHITTLIDEVKTISDQLAVKTAEAENSVDIEVINELVNQLKTSTDNLSSVVKVNE